MCLSHALSKPTQNTIHSSTPLLSSEHPNYIHITSLLCCIEHVWGFIFRLCVQAQKPISAERIRVDETWFNWSMKIGRPWTLIGVFAVCFRLWSNAERIKMDGWIIKTLEPWSESLLFGWDDYQEPRQPPPTPTSDLINVEPLRVQIVSSKTGTNWSVRRAGLDSSTPNSQNAVVMLIFECCWPSRVSWVTI